MYTNLSEYNPSRVNHNLVNSKEMSLKGMTNHGNDQILMGDNDEVQAVSDDELDVEVKRQSPLREYSRQNQEYLQLKDQFKSGSQPKTLKSQREAPLNDTLKENYPMAQITGSILEKSQYDYQQKFGF